MGTQLFAAEINLKNQVQACSSTFDELHLKCLHLDLSSYYSEVFVVQSASRILVVTVGNSPLAMINELNEVFDGAVEAQVYSAQDAISTLINLAKGERWEDMPAAAVKDMMITSIENSIEAGCFGEIIRKLVEVLLIANSRRCKSLEKERHNSIIRKPFIGPLDFSSISVN
ncbi:hypothetical protein WSM22_41940 [Cytophagales bacterium WSM2-2]|nr:hypothetical protein WSM22_41940 [Cytophagales bacterium WSM2-2]